MVLFRVSREIDYHMYFRYNTIRQNKLHSEHYGTEIIISKVIREKQPAVDRILDQMSEIGTVHRNIG